MRAPQPPVPSSGARGPRTSRESAPVIPVEPLTAPPPEITPNAPGSSIDWSEEARRAASALTEPGTFREFGHQPKADSEHKPRSPAHQVGEQYRIDAEWVVWVSERCYIVSGVPPIGLPDVLARSIPTRTVCTDNSPPPGELFKDLPAYQKFHPAPTVK
jgi:hypothetical protein